MFGMSMTELMFIGLVALLILGPNELPKVAKQFGKVMRDLRRTGDDLRDTFEREVMQELPPKPTLPPAEAIGRMLNDATRRSALPTTEAPPAAVPPAAEVAAPTAEKQADPAPDAPKGTA